MFLRDFKSLYETQALSNLTIPGLGFCSSIVNNVFLMIIKKQSVVLYTIYGVFASFVLMAVIVFVWVFKISGLEGVGRATQKTVAQEHVSNESIKSDSVNYDDIVYAGDDGVSERVFVEDAENNEVVVMDTDGSIVARIGVGSQPHDIAVSPNQRYVVTANQGDGTVSVIDTASLKNIKTVKTGKGAHGVVFSFDGNFIFVANSQEDTVSIVETNNFTEQTKISVVGYPEYIGATPDGKYIFTTNLGGSGSVTVIINAGFGSRVYKTFNPGVDPHGWAVSPDGTKIVIANLGGDVTYFFDSQTFDEIEHINTGSTTEFVAFRGNNELWVANIKSRYVSVVNVETKTVVDGIMVGEMPHGISFSYDGGLAFVPLYKSGRVVVIDSDTKSVINSIYVGGELHNSVVVRSWVSLESPM